MSVLVDTPVWSYAYRRAKRTAREEAIVSELISLIQREEAVLIGAVHQEVLSGISDVRKIEDVCATLRGFVALRASISDYERAATFNNLCRGQGVQGSSIDFLICAMAERYQAAVYTTDGDFKRFALIVGVQLHEPNAS